jgi:ribosome-binding protein aMBF1 (putative translation factor)
MIKDDNYTSKIISEFLAEIPQKEQEKTDKRMRLAARIDIGIKAKGWKKSDMAKALNKRPSEISKWLSGTHNFNSDTLFDIEQVLDIRLISLQEEPKVQTTRYQFFVSNIVTTSKSVFKNWLPTENLLIAQEAVQVYSYRDNLGKNNTIEYQS